MCYLIESFKVELFRKPCRAAALLLHCWCFCSLRGPPLLSAGRRRPSRSGSLGHRVSRSWTFQTPSSITSSAPRSQPCSGRVDPGFSAPGRSLCRRRHPPPPACSRKQAHVCKTLHESESSVTQLLLNTVNTGGP